MAAGLDDSFTELIQLENEVQQAVADTQNLAQSYQGVWSQVGSLTQQINNMDREMSNLQGTMQHLMQIHNNTQPPVMPALQTSRNPCNPFSNGHLSTVAGTPQYRPPVPPRTNTQSTPQNASAFTNTVPLTPVRLWPSSHNPVSCTSHS